MCFFFFFFVVFFFKEDSIAVEVAYFSTTTDNASTLCKGHYFLFQTNPFTTEIPGGMKVGKAVRLRGACTDSDG